MVKPLASGTAAFSLLLVIYFGVLTLVSGWSFAVSQFSDYWAYIVTLAFGFGMQVALYVYLKQLSAHNYQAQHMVAATGTTSTAAMLACCSHYLTNILPVLGVVGIVSVIAQYQTQLFWISLAINAAGLAYISRQVLLVRHTFLGSPAC